MYVYVVLFHIKGFDSCVRGVFDSREKAINRIAILEEVCGNNVSEYYFEVVDQKIY